MVLSLFVSLPMFVSLFWGSYLFARQLSQGRIIKRDAVLMLFFYMAMLLYMCHYVYFIGHRSIFFGTLYSVSNLLIYPSCYWYLCVLTGHLLRRRDVVWMCVPAALVLVCYPIVSYVQPDGVVYFRFVERVFFLGMAVFVCWRGFLMLREYRLYLDNTYSDGRGYDLLMVKVLLLVFGGLSVLSVLFGTLGPKFLYGNAFLIPSISMSLFLFLLGFVTTQLTLEVDVRMSEAVELVDLLEEPPHVDKQMCEQLERAMEEQQLYLNPELTINDIAQLLGTNRSYASQLFNNAYGIRFATFIGRYRVEYAKGILSNRAYRHDKEAIADAVSTSGFTNVQTFYRVFKEHTGMTPLAYRAKSLKGD